MSGSRRSCRCANCDMVFPDERQLQNHKEKYCSTKNLRETARRASGRAPPEVASAEFKKKDDIDEDLRFAQMKIRLLHVMHQRKIQQLEHNQRHLEAQRAHLQRHLQVLNNERVHDKISLQELSQSLAERDMAFKNEIDVIRSDIAHFGAPEHNTGDLLLDLVNEIDDLRMLYLRSGGNDPSVLSELNMLRNHVMKLQLVRKDRKHHHRHDSAASHKLAALREQNDRLERELLQLAKDAQSQPVAAVVAAPPPMYDNAFMLAQIQELRSHLGALLATRAPAPMPMAMPPVAAPLSLPIWNPALHKPAHYSEWWRGPFPAGANPTFGTKPYYPAK